MHHAAGGAGILFAHDPQRVFLRVAAVNDQGLPDLFGHGDVNPEPFALPFQVTFTAIVVQARLAHGHDARIVRQPHQLVGLRLRPAPLVGMHAYGGRHLVVLPGEREDPRKILQIDAHAQHMPYAEGARLAQHGLDVRVEAFKIQ